MGDRAWWVRRNIDDDGHWLLPFLAVMIGKGDGEVFVSSDALMLVADCEVVFRQDHAHDGWLLSIREIR